MGVAVIAAEGNGPAFPQGRQDFLQKPLVIHILPRGGQTLRCPLLRPEEEIIHVEHITAVDLPQRFRESRLARGGAALDGEDQRLPLGQFAVDGGEEGEETGVVGADHPVGRGIGCPEGI